MTGPWRAEESCHQVCALGPTDSGHWPQWQVAACPWPILAESRSVDSTYVENLPGSLGERREAFTEDTSLPFGHPETHLPAHFAPLPSRGYG